jgi:hypothetical protein
MRVRFSYLDCHEAGLCCYLAIHIENLLHPLQLFYFHLRPIYWLFLVDDYDFGEGVSVVLQFRYLSMKLHGVMSQKTSIIIFTVAVTSNIILRMGSGYLFHDSASL